MTSLDGKKSLPALEPSIAENRVALVIPTLNAAKHLDVLIPALQAQSFQPGTLLVIDSSSTDDTAERFTAAGAEVIVIPRAQFDHGGTRQRAVNRLSPRVEVVVFLTQDAVPADSDTIARIVGTFADPELGVAYGRQLPHHGAGAIEAHARLFNYPPDSVVLRPEDAVSAGIKATFCSNSFAAYRRRALEMVGGFPSGTIFGEDAAVTGRMLLSGWAKAYVAEAQVHHSHSYSIGEEFRRYFDVGVMHARAPWLLERFGKAGGEGRRFVRSELRHLARHQPLQIPSAILRSAVKLAAYHCGRREARIPRPLKRRISLNRRYWA
ncbi:glycosyltransferase family 2 protein [Inquilinus limosus]|uniref:glycosyltransferase family 2 protein n=1 Tax=Inquilinus limosus TaxID=171674 RepID=UPI0015C59551|nr:glycosyltransferase [Inquilinus limosus]